jgi:GTP-binding protein HflX
MMERAIIVARFETSKKDNEIDQILNEMALLTNSAGADVMGRFYQKRQILDKRYLLGKGKVQEIIDFIHTHNIDVIIIYNQLSNVQQRNLERMFQKKVIDRTRLILDIFATRARSLEGKLQVELAQLLYLLPRLTGIGVDLSRLGGGIGTRGPGETKLEVDRRTIQKRISIIKKKLLKVNKNRKIQRKSRKSNPLPVISLVGYTSAGKSTLFKALTGEDVDASPMLFSTLDPILRRVELNEIKPGYSFLLSDTVGFIQEMPAELSKSFKATLEEMVQSDIILHIIDMSDPNYLDRKNDVQKILAELEIPQSRVIQVFNKMDFIDDHEKDVEVRNRSDDKNVYISAKEKWGFYNLKSSIFYNYYKDYDKFSISIPQRLVNLNSVRKWAIVLSKSYHKDLINLEILCSRRNMIKFKEKYGGYLT